MLKNRLIVCLLLKNGSIVQSKRFSWHQRLGNPTAIVNRLSSWTCDELLYLDITRDDVYDLARDDLKAPNRNSIREIIQDIARHCFMPLTFGGKVRTLDDIAWRINSGADKISINTQALESPEFITAAAREFGSQCIVVSIDARATSDATWEVYKNFGRTSTKLSPAQWAREAQERGAGEIFLNSIDRDGSGQGYDIPLIQSVVQVVNIPVIACGGVSQWEHLEEGLVKGGASAVAAANIFQYTENSVYNAKKFLYDRHLNVREPLFSLPEQAASLII